MISSEFIDKPHLPRDTDTMRKDDPRRNPRGGRVRFGVAGEVKPDPIDDPRLGDPEYLDTSIEKGDEIYSKGWTLTPLYVVDVNWALRAVAVRLGRTGDIVVWPINGKVKRHA